MKYKDASVCVWITHSQCLCFEIFIYFFVTVRDDNRSSPPPITSLRWLEDEGDLKMKDSIYQICTATIGHASLDLLEFARFGTNSGSGFVKMLCSQMKVLVVALCSSMLALHVSSAPQMDELTETLQAELISDKVSSIANRSVLIRSTLGRYYGHLVVFIQILFGPCWMKIALIWLILFFF